MVRILSPCALRWTDLGSYTATYATHGSMENAMGITRYRPQPLLLMSASATPVCCPPGSLILEYHLCPPYSCGRPSTA
jgi:hypothetical protein